MKRRGLRMFFACMMAFILLIALVNPSFADEDWMAREIPAYSEDQATPMAYATNQNGDLIVVYTVYDPEGTIMPYPMAARFDGETWTEMGQGYLAEWSGGQFQIRVNEFTGQTFVGFITINGMIHIYEFIDGEWIEMSSPGRLTRIDPQFVYYDFQVMEDGALVVAFVDLLEESSITAKVYREGEWKTLGEPGFTMDPASSISLAVDHSNQVIYAAVAIERSQVEVWRYAEDSEWELTDSTSIESVYPYWVRLAMGNGDRPFLFFMDAEQEWKTSGYYYGKGIWYPMKPNPFSPPIIRSFDLVMDQEGWPLAFFNDSENESKLSVIRYDGQTWSYYGRRGLTSSNITGVFAAIGMDGKPYAYTPDPEREGQFVIMEYGELEEAVVSPVEEPVEAAVEEEVQETAPVEEPEPEGSLVIPLVLGGTAVVILFFLLLRRKKNNEE